MFERPKTKCWATLSSAIILCSCSRTNEEVEFSSTQLNADAVAICDRFRALNRQKRYNEAKKLIAVMPGWSETYLSQEPLPYRISENHVIHLLGTPDSVTVWPDEAKGGNTSLPYSFFGHQLSNRLEQIDGNIRWPDGDTQLIYELEDYPQDHFQAELSLQFHNRRLTHISISRSIGSTIIHPGQSRSRT